LLAGLILSRFILGKFSVLCYASIVVLVCGVLHMLLTAFVFVITTTFILQEWWFYLWRRIAEKCLEDFWELL